MLRKKYVVQKTIRIDAQLSEDLERLAKILDRPQSELISAAIENLMIDNKIWFKDYIFVDSLVGVLDCGDKFAEFELREEKCKHYISITVDVEFNSILKWELRDGHDYENIIDSTEIKYPDSPDIREQLIDKLIELTIHVDPNSEEVQKYLNRRLNYK